jgi:hypothetical protein
MSADDLLYYPKAAAFLGICKAKLNRLVFEGILAPPDDYGRFKRSDLEVAKAKLDNQAVEQ